MFGGQAELDMHRGGVVAVFGSCPTVPDKKML